MLAAVQRPISAGLHQRPTPRPLWKDRPTWFLVAEQDRMIVEDNQRFMAERMKARVRSQAVDHTPIVTAPALFWTYSARRSARSKPRAPHNFCGAI